MVQGEDVTLKDSQILERQDRSDVMVMMMMILMTTTTTTTTTTMMMMTMTMIMIVMVMMMSLSSPLMKIQFCPTPIRTYGLGVVVCGLWFVV